MPVLPDGFEYAMTEGQTASLGLVYALGFTFFLLILTQKGCLRIKTTDPKPIYESDLQVRLH